MTKLEQMSQVVNSLRSKLLTKGQMIAPNSLQTALYMSLITVVAVALKGLFWLQSSGFFSEISRDV